MVHSTNGRKKIKTSYKGLHKLDFPKGRSFSTRAVIYVPSTEGRVPISKKKFDERVKETIEFLSKNFGGATQISGVGAWYDNKGNLIQEKVVKVESFSPTKKYKEKDLKLKDFVKEKSKEWEQWGGISFEFEDPSQKNTGLYFVTP